MGERENRRGACRGLPVDGRGGSWGCQWWRRERHVLPAIACGGGGYWRSSRGPQLADADGSPGVIHSLLEDWLPVQARTGGSERRGSGAAAAVWVSQSEGGLPVQMVAPVGGAGQRRGWVVLHTRDRAERKKKSQTLMCGGMVGRVLVDLGMGRCRSGRRWCDGGQWKLCRAVGVDGGAAAGQMRQPSKA